MSKKSPLPHSRHHLFLYDEDWEFLQANYGPGSINHKVGVSGAVKTVVHAFVKRLKARSAEAFEEIRQGQQEDTQP